MIYQEGSNSLPLQHERRWSARVSSVIHQHHQFENSPSELGFKTLTTPPRFWGVLLHLILIWVINISLLEVDESCPSLVSISHRTCTDSDDVSKDLLATSRKERDFSHLCTPRGQESMLSFSLFFIKYSFPVSVAGHNFHFYLQGAPAY